MSITSSSGVQRVQANGIELAYETFGDPAARPLVLIMGIGAQMIFWPDELCQAFSAGGHYVVRFDNRDVGLSSRMDALGRVEVVGVMAAVALGKRPEVPYTLDEMADDTVALATALGLRTFHVCGASMGGMIAQTVAYRHGSRLRSLVSIMSTTGNPGVRAADPEALGVLLQPPPSGREAYAQHAVRVWRIIGSPGFPFDEAQVKERAGMAFDRGVSPAGVARQFGAILVHGDRSPRLESMAPCPTLVIHGEADRLVPKEGGEHTAAVIAGAELWLIPGMGHDFPPALFEPIADRISAFTERHDDRLG